MELNLGGIIVEQNFAEGCGWSRASYSCTNGILNVVKALNFRYATDTKHIQQLFSPEGGNRTWSQI